MSLCKADFFYMSPTFKLTFGPFQNRMTGWGSWSKRKGIETSPIALSNSKIDFDALEFTLLIEGTKVFIPPVPVPVPVPVSLS